MDYDDVTMRVTAARVINNAANAIFVRLKRTSDGLVYEHLFPPGSTTSITIPTTAQGRIVLVNLGRGHFSGCNIAISYPGA
jgi:hypothetical protein